MTIADKVKASEDPYLEAIARIAMRLENPANNTVTVYFEDGSSITFKVHYEVCNDSV